MRYSDRLQVWFNDKYPLAAAATTTAQGAKHQVFNKGSHGADVSHISTHVHLYTTFLVVEQQAHVGSHMWKHLSCLALILP